MRHLHEPQDVNDGTLTIQGYFFFESPHRVVSSMKKCLRREESQKLVQGTPEGKPLPAVCNAWKSHRVILTSLWIGTPLYEEKKKKVSGVWGHRTYLYEAKGDGIWGLEKVHPGIAREGRSRDEIAHDVAHTDRAQEWRACASWNTTRKEVSSRPERDHRRR